MPTIDNDLFELLSLIGLGLIVLVGLALWGALGRLRKTFESVTAEWDRQASPRGGESAPALAAARAEMPDAAAAEPAEAEVSPGLGVVPAADAQSEAEPEPAAAAEPEPAMAQEQQAAEEPAAAAEPGETWAPGPAVVAEPVTAEEPEPTAAEEPAPAATAMETGEPAEGPEEHEAAASSTAPAGAPMTADEEPAPAGAMASPEPAHAVQEPVGATAESGAEQPAATMTEAEPQEQPFERDGRWWFRRGDELLVYDEMSGQWEPAPESGIPASGTEELPAADSEAAAGEAQSGSFWKCPSCGAVNGSTATSCRMCFAARP
jgi:hypothetical protein